MAFSDSNVPSAMPPKHAGPVMRSFDLFGKNAMASYVTDRLLGPADRRAHAQRREMRLQNPYLIAIIDSPMHRVVSAPYRRGFPLRTNPTGGCRPRRPRGGSMRHS